jgi:hypothetical protein
MTSAQTVSVVKDSDSFHLTKPPLESAAVLKKSDVLCNNKKGSDDEDHAEVAPPHTPNQKEKPGAICATKSLGKENRGKNVMVSSALPVLCMERDDAESL